MAGNEGVVVCVKGVGVCWVSFHKCISNHFGVAEDKERIASQMHVDGAEIVMTGSP